MRKKTFRIREECWVTEENSPLMICLYPLSCIFSDLSDCCHHSNYLACQGFWTPLLFEILPVCPNIVPSVQLQCHILTAVVGDEPGVDFFTWMFFLWLGLSTLTSNLLIPWMSMNSLLNPMLTHSEACRNCMTSSHVTGCHNGLDSSHGGCSCAGVLVGEGY